MAASPKEVRRARAYLQQRGARGMISPRKFANAAKEMNKSFSDIFMLIARMYMGGQGQAQRISELVRKAAEAGA